MELQSEHPSSGGHLTEPLAPEAAACCPKQPGRREGKAACPHARCRGSGLCPAGDVASQGLNAHGEATAPHSEQS